jgi:hypothetical protein
MIASRRVLRIRRREPASLKLAANDASPDNAERERHDAHAMARRDSIVKTPKSPQARISARAANARELNKLFRFSELSAMMGRRGKSRDVAALVVVRRVLSGKRRNKKAIKPLKTNDSAKSRNFALNDFNGLSP